MAKKQFGKLAVLAALAGTAVGITYCLRYKTFHEELEEDFHDFEEDLDEFDSKEEESSPKRNYVSLTPEKVDSAQMETAPVSPEETLDKTEDSSAAEAEPDKEQEDFLDSDMEFLDDEPMDSESMFDEEDSRSDLSSSATTIVEDEEPEQ